MVTFVAHFWRNIVRYHAPMWIFGYGSLMFDGWESGYGCVRREWASLSGYRRRPRSLPRFREELSTEVDLYRTEHIMRNARCALRAMLQSEWFQYYTELPERENGFGLLLGIYLVDFGGPDPCETAHAIAAFSAQDRCSFSWQFRQVMPVKWAFSVLRRPR
jgi:hypothetical protein